MRTTLHALLASENGRRIIQELVARPRMLWSCAAMEDATGIPHASVFRAFRVLAGYGVLSQQKVNRRDLVFELVRSPLTDNLAAALRLQEEAAASIARTFAASVRKLSVSAVVLFGSAAAGHMKQDSDIDILVVLERRNPALERRIHGHAAGLSAEMNQTVSVVVFGKAELARERRGAFLTSVRKDMVLVHGTDPFGAGEAVARSG